jgi:hypothetical protein
MRLAPWQLPPTGLSSFILGDEARVELVENRTNGVDQRIVVEQLR